MDLIIAIGALYIGAPLGLLAVLIGLIGLLKRNKQDGYGKAGVFLTIGILMLCGAGIAFVALMNTNLSL